MRCKPFMLFILMMVMMVGVARADEVTFEVNASYIFNNGDGSVFPFVFTQPILYATGTISFDPLAAIVHNPDTTYGNVPLNYDLLFSWAGGSLEYAGIGQAFCANFYGDIYGPGATTCTLGPDAGLLQPGDGWGFQTNLFNANTLVPGSSIYACSARNTIYPDGSFGNMASGICGATSTAHIQGINGGIYGLRLGEGGPTGTSGTFTVVNTDEPKSLELLTSALAILILVIWRQK